MQELRRVRSGIQNENVSPTLILLNDVHYLEPMLYF